jgi:membrane protease YdiL (CAAX protease family)
MEQYRTAAAPDPPQRFRPGLWLGVFLFAYNNVTNLLPSLLHAKIYVGLNIVCLALVWTAVHRYLNLSRSEIGVTRRGFGKSFLWGLAFTAAVILPLVLALKFLPVTGLKIGPPRLDGITSATIWSRVFFRIPLGTVLFEEMLFRGIFFGYLKRRQTPVRAVLISSLFFAFWHIVPAYEVVSYNFRIGSILLGVIYWVVGMAGAFIAGLGFAFIRKRTDNLAGCLLAHYLINSLTLTIIYVSWK